MLNPFVPQIDRALKKLSESPLADLQLKTITTLFMFYHTGVMDVDSVVRYGTENKLNRRELAKRLNTLVSIKLLVRCNETRHIEYKLHPRIRKLFDEVL